MAQDSQPIRNLGVGRFFLGFFLCHKYLKEGRIAGRDERIRTSDPLNPIHTKNPAVIGFQPLTLSTERNNAEESRNFRNLSATWKAEHNQYNPELAVLRKFQN